MNFDKLPNEIKQMIFDRNREAAKDNRYKQNFEMLQLELKVVFEDEEEHEVWSTGEVKPSAVCFYLPFDPNSKSGDGTREGALIMRRDLVEAWYKLANHKVLPCYDFLYKYLCSYDCYFTKCDDPDEKWSRRSFAIDCALDDIHELRECQAN